MGNRTSRPAAGTIARRRWAANKKAQLIQQLGGKCVECGTSLRLTFDHINGRDWDIRAVHSTKRLRIYEAEIWLGEIQLLCLSCNSRKGRPQAAEESF